MTKIGRVVLDQVLAALVHPTAGFNARIAAHASDYQVEPFEIDFAGSNFFRAFVDPMMLIESQSNASLPMMCLYSTGSINRPETNRIRFEGDVNVVIDYTVGIAPDFIEGDQESRLDLVEEAIVDLLYEHSFVHPVYYDSRISWNRYQIEPRGDNWTQTIRFQVQFLLAY